MPPLPNTLTTLVATPVVALVIALTFVAGQSLLADDTAPAEPIEPNANLAQVPGLAERLDGYLGVRREQVGKLAEKYLRGLSNRLDKAADAGNAKLAQAFRAEQQRVETLVEQLAAAPADRIAAATAPATLPELPEASPPAMVKLRETWTGERGKIRAQLDTALQKSLQSLESELTRQRAFEHAEAVLTWREGLLASSGDVGSDSGTPEEEKVMASSTSKSPPSPDDGDTDAIFPLPMPERPIIAGRVEVHRRDGRSLSKEDEENGITQIPEELGGRVVDLVAGQWDDDYAMIALLDDGTITGWGAGNSTAAMKESGAFDGMDDVVMVRFSTDVIVCLKSDGSLSSHVRGKGASTISPSLEESFVQIARSANSCIALTNTGRVVVVFAKRELELPKEMPPTTMITQVWSYAPWYLGSDGICRYWDFKSAKFEHSVSNVSPRSTSFEVRGSHLCWIDEKGKAYSRFFKTGADALANSINNARGTGLRWVSGFAFVALESESGEWEIGYTSTDDDRRDMERNLKGAINVVCSIDTTYYFVVRPVGG